MYSVTQDYLTYIKKRSKIISIRGKITKGSIVTPITIKDIVAGYPTIDRKAVSENNFNIGNVYVDSCELKLGISDDKAWKNINRAELELEFGLELGSPDLVEWIPLGVFDIPSDGVVYEGITVTIKADSRMARFDRSLGDIATSGTPFELLSWCCLKCDMELGMTKEQVSALPNGTEALVLDKDSGCETYRDIIMWIAQLVCGFATTTRDGKLELRSFTNAPVYEIPQDLIKKVSYNDVPVNIKNVSMKIGENFINYQPTVVPEQTLPLDTNPLVQENTIPEVMQNRVNAIGKEAEKIRYTPFKLEFSGDAALDIGDNISIEGETGVYCITSFAWKFSSINTIEGVPFSNKNSKKQSSKTSTSSSGGGSAIQNNYKILRYENPTALNIGGKKEQVLLMRFELPENGVPLLNLSMIMNVETEGTFEIVMKYDNVDLLFVPKNKYTSGYHTFTLSFNFEPVDVEMEHILICTMVSIDGGSATIDELNLNASITAWGLNEGGKEWDGNLAFSEKIPKADLDWLRTIQLRTIKEDITTV